MPDDTRTEDDRIVGLNDQLRAYARDLRGALARARAATDELSRTHLETVAALAAAIDVRDEVTGGHVYRVANYGLVLTEHLEPDLATDPQLIYGFLLHDIGKLGVPDRILLKAGPLDPDEQAQMRQHVEYGVKFIDEVSFLRPALQVVATHHESWDGSGYPRSLSGEEIPYVTRMFAVCDAFDAMVHDRPYRPGMSAEQALEELTAGAGSQFDPAVVAGFEEVLDDILDVSERPEVPRLRSAPPGANRPTLSGHVMFERVDEGLLLLSPDGTIRDANPAFLELFGIARPPVGLTLAELTDRAAHRFADPARARADARSLPRELFSNPSETTLRLVEPEHRTIRRIARTLYDDHGTAIGRLLEYRDITRREAGSDDRLEDARAALGDLLASTDTAPEVRAAAADALDRLEGASGR